jgi:hypothetical protein
MFRARHQLYFIPNEIKLLQYCGRGNGAAMSFQNEIQFQNEIDRVISNDMLVQYKYSGRIAEPSLFYKKNALLSIKII